MVETTTIEKTECIGNSLVTINGNFNNLKDAINNLETGVAIQDEGTELGTNIKTINFIGDGVDTIVSNGVANIIVPGSEIRKVIQLEEQGTNSGGGDNNFFILDDGSLRGCGRNQYGELGMGKGDTKIYTPRIAAFDPPLAVNEGIYKLYTQGAITYVITTYGRVYGAGYNAQGQLGQGTTQVAYYAFRFINVLNETTTAINLETNPVYGWAAAANDPIVQLATGSGSSNSNTTTYALTQSGRLYAWGYNNRSQAGISRTTTGNTITVPTPVTNLGAFGRYVTAAGNNNSTTVFVVDADDKLYVCGRNQDGQAGINDNTGAELNISNFRLVQGLPFGYRVNNIRVGGTADQITTFVTLKDGTLYAAGANTNGAVLGSGQATPVTQVAFVRVSGFLDSDFIEDVACHIDSNAITMWALIRDGDNYRVKCWGNDTFGQMGLGSTATTRAVTSSTGWPWVVTGAKVKQLVVAGNGTAKATLVLDTNNRLWAAGYGTTGLIGNSNTLNTNSTFRRVLFNPALGYPIDIRSTNNDYGSGTRANFITILNTGKALAWGYDNTATGQLGVDTAPDITSVPSIVQIIL